jgi:hypothetical protein
VQNQQVEVFFLPQNTTEGIVYNVFCDGSDVFTVKKADDWQFHQQLNGLLSGQEHFIRSLLLKQTES